MPLYQKPNYGSGWRAPSLPIWQTEEAKSGGAYPWANAANDNALIAKYRKGNCRVSVRSAANNPIAGASITVSQKEHSFAFGCMLDYRKFDSVPSYANDIKNGPWNSYVAQNEHKQGVWERPVDDPSGLGRHIVIAKQGLVDNLKPWRLRRGHALNYTQALYLVPDPPYGVTKASRRAYWRDVHLPDKAAVLKSCADVWELTNEVEVSIVYTQTAGAKRNDPDFISDLLYAVPAAFGRPLYVNDYTTNNYIMQLAEGLIAQGIPIAGVGYQSHSNTSPRSTLHAMSMKVDGSPAPWWTIITENDFPTISAGSIYNSESEALSACFANPSCISRCDWGTHNPTWNNAIAYFSSTGVPTARYTALMDKIRDQWWTQTNGSSNGLGYLEFNGFFGEYEVAVTYNGVTKTRRFELAPTMPEEVFVFE